MHAYKCSNYGPGAQRVCDVSPQRNPTRCIPHLTPWRMHAYECDERPGAQKICGISASP